jgi:uroporphyrinogen-III synthase
MVQNRITILSTKALDQALIQDASAKNVVVDIISLIKTEATVTIGVLEEVVKHSGESTAIAFTSVNAVEALGTGLSEQKINPRNWKIFCIGHATKQSVVKYFGEKSIGGVADNAKELAKTILNAKVGELIFFCGDQRRDELPALLKKQVTVREIIVYKTIATLKRIEKKYEAILFFSPSAVKSFFEYNVPADQTVLFSIGNTTADEIKKFSKNKVVVSDTPEAKTLLQKAIAFFQTNRIHH